MTWRRVSPMLVALLLVGCMASSVSAATVLRWKRNPVQFVLENCGVEPDAWQQDALMAFASPLEEHRRISLQACAGPGKSAVLAWCGLNFLTCYGTKVDHPKGAAVSITGDNLKDNLWAEYSNWMGRSVFLQETLEWQKERIVRRDHPAESFIAARTWPKSASPDEQGKTLSGLHSKYVLGQIDESGGIPETVLRAGEQALSNCAFGKLMQAGNPFSLDGMLYAAATRLRHQWYVIRINGDPEDSKRSPRIDLQWAKDQIKTYGRDNPWVMSYILGMFPPASINSLLGVDEVETAMTRHLRIDQYDWAQKRLGVDVARYGDDRTVIFPRQGLAAFRPVVMRHKRDSAVSVDIANRVMAAKARWGAELECFDATGGWAAGAVDVMRTNGCSPIDVQFAAPALDAKYANRRAEIWFQMASWIQGGGALPPIPEMVAELTTPTYTFHKGKFLLEDKDQVKKRIGRSPDLADALALTFGLPDMPGSMAAPAMMAMRKGATAVTEFDPYRREDSL